MTAAPQLPGLEPAPPPPAPAAFPAPLIRFFVMGVPIPQGSKKGFVRGGRAVLVEANPKHADWRATVAYEAKMFRRTYPEMSLPLDGPLGARFTFRFVRPASISAKQRPLPCVTPDLSKLVRCVEDSLTAILIVDDARIVQIDARKEYASEPGVLIELWKVT